MTEVPPGRVGSQGLLAAAGAMRTFHSGVGLEAPAFQGPAGRPEAFGEERPLPHARAGAATVARTVEDLVRAPREDRMPGVRTAQRGTERARDARDNLPASDGKCSERGRDLVVSLTQGGRA